MMGKQCLFAVIIMILMVLLLLMMYLEHGTKRPLLGYPFTPTKADQRDEESVTLPSKDYITEKEALKGKPLTDIKETVSVELSTVTLKDSRTIYKVGEEIKMFITLRNGYNVSRSQGGDHLRVRIYNEHSKAYAAGHVLDHDNGSYTAVLRAIWPGMQTISLALVYRRESIRAIYYIRRKLPSTRNIVAGFSYNTYEETTRCHADRGWLTNYTDICNFTLMNGGAPWYCGKPKNPNLLCEDWMFVKKENPYPKLPLTDVENQLLGTKRSMFPDISIDVRGKMADRENLPSCSSYPKQELWQIIQPTGYFYKDVWYLHHCNGPSTKDFKQCLRDTHLMISGDSTTREWYSYLSPYLSCKRLTEAWTRSAWHKRSACRIPSLNFTMEWLPHGQPFYVGNQFRVNKYTLNAESNQIDEIKSDVKVVYVIHMFMHNLAFHYSVFTDRMRRISRSVKRLFERNKHAKVLIKGPHTYTLSPDGIKRLSDYFGYLYRDIMYEEFNGLHDKIIYMDQKDMTIAKAIEPNHPPRKVVEQTVNQMLNYICE